MNEKLDNVDEKWFRAEISKKDLKQLSKKSDLKGCLLYTSPSPRDTG